MSASGTSQALPVDTTIERSDPRDQTSKGDRTADSTGRQKSSAFTQGEGDQPEPGDHDSDYTTSGGEELDELLLRTGSGEPRKDSVGNGDGGTTTGTTTGTATGTATGSDTGSAIQQWVQRKVNVIPSSTA